MFKFCRASFLCFLSFAPLFLNNANAYTLNPSPADFAVFNTKKAYLDKNPLAAAQFSKKKHPHRLLTIGSELIQF